MCGTCMTKRSHAFIEGYFGLCTRGYLYNVYRNALFVIGRRQCVAASHCGQTSTVRLFSVQTMLDFSQRTIPPFLLGHPHRGPFPTRVRPPRVGASERAPSHSPRTVATASEVRDRGNRKYHQQTRNGGYVECHFDRLSVDNKSRSCRGRPKINKNEI